MGLRRRMVREKPASAAPSSPEKFTEAVAFAHNFKARLDRVSNGDRKVMEKSKQLGNLAKDICDVTHRWGNSRTHLVLQFYNLLMGTNKVEMKQERLCWILNYICEYHLDEEDRQLK